MRPIDLLGPRIIKGIPQASGLEDAESRRRLMPPGLVRDVIIALDAVLVLVCSVLAKLLYIDVFMGTGIAPNYVGVGCLAAVICIWWIKDQRLQEDDFHSLPAGRLLKALFVSFCLLVVLGAALKLTDVFSRGWMSTWFVLTFAMILLKDRMSARLLELLAKRGHIGRHVAIYGAGEQGRALKAELEQRSPAHLTVELYDAHSGVTGAEIGVTRGDIRTLIQDGLNNRFERIILCLPADRMQELPTLIENISFLPVTIQVCPDQLGWAGTTPRLTYSQGRYFVDVSEPPLKHWGGIGKRMLDIGVGGVMAVIALPLAALAALAIKLDSRGPVFARQRRHGYNHQTIEVFTFRTSVEPGTVDGDGVEPDPSPEPLTRAGQWLSWSRIDKLPQLINVLAGEMSLVGPRPHALAHNYYCNEVVARYANRHKVKPGMTGWAQVHGFRESTGQMETMADQAAADIHYIENWSTILDLKILTLTPFLWMFGHPESAPVKAVSRLLGVGRADFGPARAAVSRSMARTHSANADVSPDEFLIEGVKVSTLSVADAARKIAEECGAESSKAVFTINLDHIVKLRVDRAFRNAYDRANLILADGFPIVWAGRILGRRLDRATGSDLIAPLCAEAARKRLRVFLLGSTFDVLAKSARVLTSRYPGLEICGVYAPSRDFDPASQEALDSFEMLRTTGADICFVALGAPKQELLATRGCEHTQGTTFICIGGGLDFIVGAQVRAPRFVQALSLEWMWRLSSNPKRLAARYLKCLAIVPSFFIRTLGGGHSSTR
jgi:exopolysaccharide biosynthesis polyprenyl glycosylphosphotransferase